MMKFPSSHTGAISSKKTIMDSERFLIRVRLPVASRQVRQGSLRMARRSHRQLAFFSVAKQAMRSSSGRPERGL